MALPIENENTLKIPPNPITIGKYTVMQRGALLDKKFCTYEELDRREREQITRVFFPVTQLMSGVDRKRCEQFRIGQVEKRARSVYKSIVFLNYDPLLNSVITCNLKLGNVQNY